MRVYALRVCAGSGAWPRGAYYFEALRWVPASAGTELVPEPVDRARRAKLFESGVEARETARWVLDRYPEIEAFEVIELKEVRIGTKIARRPRPVRAS